MSYGNSGLNKVVKDDSGFSPQQRHDIIMATLEEFGKGTQAFQSRWRENSGEYLTGDILLKTPMFWFMKFKWSRQEIETLFFKARVVIDERFDRGLQQTFGGDPGPRWKGGGGVKKKNWKRVADQIQDNEWIEPDEEKKEREDDTMDYNIKHPNFQYNPVVQPVDFQATGGVDNKDKDTNNKEYGKPGWERLKKKTNDDNGGYGPTMGKGKMPDNPDKDKIKLAPTPDYSKWKDPTGDNICIINIQCPDGSIMKLKVKLNEPLHYVKKQIEYKGNELGKKYPENKQILYFKNAQLLNNDALLESYGIKDGDTLQLSMGPITVNVVKKDGTKLQIMVDPHATLGKVKKEIESNTYPSIPAQEQQIYPTEKRNKDEEFLDNYKTINQYGIYDNDIIYLGGPTVWRAPKSDDAYPIYVETPDGRTLTLNVTSKDDIEYVKLQIQTITNGKYPIDEQRLWFKNLDTGNAKELTNPNSTLKDENIKKGALLKLGPYDLFVDTPEGKRLKIRDVSPYESIKNLKKKVENQANNVGLKHPANTQKLFNQINNIELLAGNNGNGNKTIDDYDIKNNSILYLSGTIPVTIRKSDGTTFIIDVDPSQPCRIMKETISKKLGEKGINAKPQDQTLIFKSIELNDNKDPKSYGIPTEPVESRIVDLKIGFPIIVVQPHGKDIILDVDENDSILSVKQRLEYKTMPSVPVKAQTLTFKNKDLENNGTISGYGLARNDRVILSIDNDDPLALLEKISSRDAPQIERINAINKINDNVGKNKKYDVLLDKDKIQLLNAAYAVQILDDDYRQPVAQNAIQTAPNVFKTSLDKEPDLTMGVLDETLDSLFKIYDDPKCRKLHNYAKKAIKKIVDDVINTNDPKNLNKLLEKLGEKVDTENIVTPEVRKFAMREFQKSMFPDNNPIMDRIFAGNPEYKLDYKEDELPKPNSKPRNWFDIATGDKPGPPTTGDKHRDIVAKTISEMITDPNRDNKQIGLNLADLFNRKNNKFKDRLDGHARPIFMKWNFDPLKEYNMKMPPKGPKKKYKVDPLEPVDYKIKQKTALSIAPSALPDL